MQDKTPLVAVITRTKDRPILLERAIQSVHSQTEKDFIHVIINDAGDPEPVEALLREYKSLVGERVKVIHNKKSKGMEAASNLAIKSVNSVYIAIHDDDDTWHPDFLKETTGVLREKDAKGVVVRTDKVTEALLDDGKVKRLSVEQWMSDMKSITLYRQCIDNQMTPITFVYERSVYDEIGYYDETLPVLGDWDFGIRFLKKYDVEYLDLGFALANYHHRKQKKKSASSNYSSTEKHRYYSTKLMNKYLREEIARGELGVGYIMSKLRYDQSNIATIVKKFLPNSMVSVLKRKIQN